MNTAEKRALKQPDQFVAATGQGVAWASQHRNRAIVIALFVVGAILLAVGGYSWFDHRSTQAATDFGAAMQTYQTPLRNPAQPLPPGVKTFNSAAERAAAANGEFLAVANHYGATKSGKLAKYFAGLTYMEEGQNASAESTLKSIAGSWDHSLAALGKLALAQLYQQTGRDAQAADLYNELSTANAVTVPPGLAKIQLAEMFQAEGKTDQARKIYAELKDKDKDAKGQPGVSAEVATEKLNPSPTPAPGPQ